MLMNPRALRLQYARRYKESQAPVFGLFELTGRCNLNCKMCYVHTKSNADFLKTEKDGDWWIAQIDAACARGMLFATVTGGECFLHPDFQRIYMHLKQSGVFVQLNTNGLLLNKKNVDFLRENPPLEIQITLYAADNAGYESVTGFPVFDKVAKNIIYAKSCGLNIRIEITPNAFAPNETERLIQYIKSIDVPYSINAALMVPHDQTDSSGISDYEVDIDTKIRYLRIQKGSEVSTIPEDELPPIGGEKTELCQGLTCTAGRVAFAISHDGYMMPCNSLYKSRVPMSGAVDFEKAWKQMLEISSEYLMPIECEGCAYRKACLSCPVLRSGKVGNGHCDPDICKMTRKLVAAGVKTLK